MIMFSSWYTAAHWWAIKDWGILILLAPLQLSGAAATQVPVTNCEQPRWGYRAYVLKRVMAPKDVYLLIPRTYEYLTSYTCKKDFADMTKL